jgi:hypothetical protein
MIDSDSDKTRRGFCQDGEAERFIYLGRDNAVFSLAEPRQVRDAE